MSARQKQGAAAVLVGLVGFALICVLLLDSFASTFRGSSVGLGLVENVVPLSLAAILVWMSYRIATTNSDVEYLTVIAKWVGLGTLVGVGIIAWTLGVQAIEGHLDPAAVVIDILALVVGLSLLGGVREAQRRGEHKRFQGLFEHIDSAIAEVTVSGTDVRIERANESFRKTFGYDREEGGDLTDIVEADLPDIATELRAGRDVDAEVHVETEHGERDYLLRTANLFAGDEGIHAHAVFMDITAQKERERALQRESSAREQALEERTTQLEFLHSLLRHDVQNGMMVIRSRAEFLSNELDGKLAGYADTIAARSEDITDQIDRMRTTLDALTDEGAGHDRVDLSAVLDGRVEALRETRQEVTVESEVEDGLAVEADDMLDDVFDNLLRNAVVHNDSDHPTVRVTAAETDDEVVVRVEDDGPGVPEEHRENVFRRGVSNPNDGSGSGSGFGLFFVDTMVNSYGGDVRVEDSDLGGAEFVVTLPAV
ncbi:ATP-binding protein [Halarchaeum sp. P4]|uniref:ATP-binding protein n=1 Tax=Halarchaeum sp. P4 TaxID=3421639 RepID=UPI003EC0A37D